MYKNDVFHTDDSVALFRTFSLALASTYHCNGGGVRQHSLYLSLSEHKKHPEAQAHKNQQDYT